MNIGQEHLDGGKGFHSWRDTQLRYYPLHPAETSEGEVPVQILTSSGPDSQWAAIRQLYVFMIGAAQSHVYIQSPFFIPDATIAEALKTAALADADVRVMLSARPSGNRLPHWAGTTYVADIVASGVRVFLYDKGYLHAKTISVDGGERGMRGSHVIHALPLELQPQRAAERTRGATDRSVTPREELVELRGLEPLTPRLPALCSPN
jgi:cardiolipin synthase